MRGNEPEFQIVDETADSEFQREVEELDQMLTTFAALNNRNRRREAKANRKKQIANKRSQREAQLHKKDVERRKKRKNGGKK